MTEPEILMLQTAGEGWRSLARILASLPLADRHVVLDALMAGVEPEVEYDREWVDLDEDCDDLGSGIDDSATGVWG